MRTFESLVNSEECQTVKAIIKEKGRLRVLLIQKSVKQLLTQNRKGNGLRVLLIQKSVKHSERV